MKGERGIKRKRKAHGNRNDRTILDKDKTYSYGGGFEK